MAPEMWREAEIAYRRERIASDFARGRTAVHETRPSTERGRRHEHRLAISRLGRALHVIGA